MVKRYFDSEMREAVRSVGKNDNQMIFVKMNFKQKLVSATSLPMGKIAATAGVAAAFGLLSANGAHSEGWRDRLFFFRS